MLKDAECDLSGAYVVVTLIDAYNELFRVLGDTDKQLCKKELEEARLLFTGSEDSNGDFMVLTHGDDDSLEPKVSMGGKYFEYDEYDSYHTELSFRHIFSEDIYIDRMVMWYVEVEDLPQQNTNLCSTKKLVADVCLGLLIVINHLHGYPPVRIHGLFVEFEWKLLSIHKAITPRSEPPMRQLGDLPFRCKRKLGSLPCVATPLALQDVPKVSSAPLG